MSRRSAFVELLPAMLLAVVVGAALGYLRLAPAPGEPVAAVFRPGLSTTAAVAMLAGGWRLVGVAAARPLAVLLLWQPAGGGDAAPAGAWLLLRASGAGGCVATSSKRTWPS